MTAQLRCSWCKSSPRPQGGQKNIITGKAKPDDHSAQACEALPRLQMATRCGGRQQVLHVLAEERRR